MLHSRDVCAMVPQRGGGCDELCGSQSPGNLGICPREWREAGPKQGEEHAKVEKQELAESSPQTTGRMQDGGRKLD